jgi:hypothetical protein
MYSRCCCYNCCYNYNVVVVIIVVIVIIVFIVIIVVVVKVNDCATMYTTQCVCDDTNVCIVRVLCSCTSCERVHLATS